jgi:UPF0716 protein FxsA
MRRLLFLIAFGGYAILEIWLLTLLADVISISGVIFLCIALFFVGIYVIKLAGVAALRSLNDSLTPTVTAATPGSAAAAASSGLLALGGLFIALPGPITTVLGLLLLIPFVRRFVARVTGRAISRRVDRYVGPVSPAGFSRGDETIVVTSVVRDEDVPKPNLPPQALTDHDDIAGDEERQ